MDVDEGRMMPFAILLIAVPTQTYWYSSVVADPLTDQTMVIVIGENAGVSGPGLCVRLTPGELSLYLSTSMHLGETTIPVTWRFDAGEPSTSNWTISTSGRSAIYAGDAWTALRTLLRSERVLIGFTPPGHNRRTFAFHTEGLREELVSSNFPMMFL
jgi:hypothetical protein